METVLDYAVPAVVIGVGATVVTDVWAFARQRFFAIPPPDYGLVGRWFAYMARGKFRHERIAAAPPVRGELALGWLAHYATGIAFAGVLLALFGLDWARAPSLAPALFVGVASVAAPFLLMQPGMGAGIAASRTPCPPVARIRSFLTHAVFGAGLYAAGSALALLRSL
jgi:hypothetical protein